MPKSKKSKKKGLVGGGGTTGPTGKVQKSAGAKKRKKVLKQSTLTPTNKIALVQRALAGHVVTANLTTPEVTAYVSAMNDDTATLKRRKTASEAMGESGAVAYLNDITGRTLTILRPDTTTPFVGSCNSGVPWTVAVAFNGAGVADVVHWDGETLHVVEAKGGGSALVGGGLRGRVQMWNHTTGERRSQRERADAPLNMTQGTERYLRDIAHGMCNAKKADGRQVIGQAIIDALDGGTAEYIPVSTKLNEGATDATVMVINRN